jgi:peptide chain release factor 1
VIAVAVLPLYRQVDDALPMADVDITTQRGHGSGGQNQNKVESAVRVVHKPTGLTVFINGRDQYRNKQLALEIIQARLVAAKKDAAQQAHNRMKMEQLGSGSRSGKIRTYNFIGSIVTDHRTGVKTHRLSEVMKGRLELLW